MATFQKSDNNHIEEERISQKIETLLKTYKSICENLQGARSFIYSELRIGRSCTLNLEKERNLFHQIIDSIDDEDLKTELIKVKQVFFTCVKQQMVLFQQTIKNHISLMETIESKHKDILLSDNIKCLQRQKETLLSYLISSTDISDVPKPSWKNFQLRRQSQQSSLLEERSQQRNFLTIPDHSKSPKRAHPLK